MSKRSQCMFSIYPVPPKPELLGANISQTVNATICVFLFPVPTKPLRAISLPPQRRQAPSAAYPSWRGTARLPGRRRWPPAPTLATRGASLRVRPHHPSAHTSHRRSAPSATSLFPESQERWLRWTIFWTK